MIGSTSLLKPCVLVYAAVLLMTCVYNFAISSLAFCRLEKNCDGVTVVTVQGMYSRTTAASCFMSTVTLLHKYCAAMPAYVRNVRAYEVYAPTAAARFRERALHDAVYKAACLLIIVPINVLRLVLTYREQNRDMFIATFLVLMYVENASMCLVETRFVALCRALGTMFADVNRDLERLADEIVAYPMAPGSAASGAAAPGAAARVATGTVYGADFYRPARAPQFAANAAEVLRIRHRLVRDAAHVLNDLFGIPMGSSLFTLGVMALFDIYYEVFNFAGVDSRLSVFIYMWLLQYSLRFYMIVMTAHGTTKQVGNSAIGSHRMDRFKRTRVGSTVILIRLDLIAQLEFNI